MDRSCGRNSPPGDGPNPNSRSGVRRVQNRPDFFRPHYQSRRCTVLIRSRGVNELEPDLRRDRRLDYRRRLPTSAHTLRLTILSHLRPHARRHRHLRNHDNTASRNVIFLEMWRRADYLEVPHQRNLIVLRNAAIHVKLGAATPLTIVGLDLTNGQDTLTAIVGGSRV